MLARHATYAGTHASVTDAINVPRGAQEPRVPIMVGGNGPNVTWRLAARYADELNLDWLTPDEVREARTTINTRCEEFGRDPATLRNSVNIGRHDLARAGAERCWRATASRGGSGDGALQASATDDEALDQFADDPGSRVPAVSEVGTTA
jgi:alkanesulfonate monooxygenase SsuD/methylene tetrahydromethanopterin reductase-like flavin-dependent oxidoreductase (luciferase family)